MPSPGKIDALCSKSSLFPARPLILESDGGGENKALNMLFVDIFKSVLLEPVKSSRIQVNVTIVFWAAYVSTHSMSWVDLVNTQKAVPIGAE